MSTSLPGNRDLPASQYDLSTTLFTSSAGLQNAKDLLTKYRSGQIQSMSPELWQAKKIVDSTLHPDTGEPVLLPFRMSCYVFSNLIVTAGMLIPGMKWKGTLAWQIANQSLNVAINSANANKSTPLSTAGMIKSYLMAVSASCSVALGLNSIVPRLKSVSPSTKVILGRLVPFAAVASAGALNVFLMRGEEIRQGIDVYPFTSVAREEVDTGEKVPVTSLGKSQKAATIAVGETAISRVVTSTPVMVIPPLLLLRFQKTELLKRRPYLAMPINIVDRNHQNEKNNLPQQQTLFYPCVYTTQYPKEAPISETLIDEKLKNFDADFIKLGDELRHERKMKVVKYYTQHSSDDKKRLKLLLRFAIVSKLRKMQRLPKREADAERLAMFQDPNFGSRVDA
ncbi:Tricarboxylate carrier-domain-containing protein [Aspergillus caelatus]|uniref:Tricarboxylate carrier-domain-containing protein n=1 Tax=Aspergillus caelatus TaxID=61420 RepID=A0A5N7A6T0_9EURO|nr:Tricarboxylate carrier-domain-containing protein [Aspergillus caelatus]KAE8365567.1 Tricarboxylate carrier-domain-containing protein [Aspergillus caelatus]